MNLTLNRMSAKSENSGKIQGNGFCLINNREKSWKLFVFVSSINRGPDMLEKTYKRTNNALNKIFGFHFPLWE